MTGEKEQWFGPGETARRLGVTTKALRVYERQGLVVPRRAQSRWRLYGPAQIARLHQIIVLRDLGLPLKAIRTLIGSQPRLAEVLRLQRESLKAQQDRIGRALALSLCQNGSRGTRQVRAPPVRTGSSGISPAGRAGNEGTRRAGLMERPARTDCGGRAPRSGVRLWAVSATRNRQYRTPYSNIDHKLCDESGR
ncbi:MAG TPA: MerR family transcriptional regulator [Rhizomicrobium sp.]|jgi:DNA-binding transcriptional MerR regulator|nr:MerR family transcriptional regulator [Rhizomicrobium sp.]